MSGKRVFCWQPDEAIKGRQRRRGLRRRGAGVVAVVALGLTLGVGPAFGQITVKWDQPPVSGTSDNLYYGWNETSVYGGDQIAADDWVCSGNDPVADIHWWGSFAGWTQATLPPDMPQRFHLAIWTDVPVVPPSDPYSHPGQLVWEYWCSDFTAEFAGWDYDPRTQSWEACFLFHCDLPVDAWFVQPGEETVYWLSIAAEYVGFIPEHVFGWKTRPRDNSSPAPDAAVRMFDPTRPVMGSLWGSGEPIYWPPDDTSAAWDLAFYLTTVGGDDLKWDQPPLLNPESPYPDCYWGWDEVSDYSGTIAPIIADDWVCTDQRPVTDVHWWGSYVGWNELGPPPQVPAGFYIGIWTDVPAGVDRPFSHPGQLVWQLYVDYLDTNEVPVGCDYHPDWCPAPETCFYYTFQIPEELWFFQPGEQVVYWISISAVYPFGPPDHPWGWKTRMRDAGSLAPDDAVRIFAPPAPQPGQMFEDGEPIWWPTEEDSWDMAFQLTTRATEPQIKWNQPPEPFNPPDGYTGWNELSWIGNEQIVADDWVCTTSDPVTRIEWWGSCIGWSRAEPPQLPDAFHLTIWTDVPAGTNEPFSHPGEVIWEYDCFDFTVEFAGWDFDPRDPTAPPEACYHFACDLPQAAWFYQDPGEHIYWLSVGADYTVGPPEMYFFGMKVRPRDPNSPAPDDAVRIFSPTQPMIGMNYGRGEPIYWPTPEDSWDLAFRLVGMHTEPNELEPKWQQDPYPPFEGFDAVSNVWLSSLSPPEEVNGVVADDFVSDGRDIRALRWYGSYWDDRYAPDTPGMEPYVLDGWLIAIHWAKDEVPGCPPDILVDPPPTVIAVYFAPADAVQIAPLDCADCLGHALYEYYVDLSDCCLICSNPDPRTNYPPPGLPGAFQEIEGMRYWVSIQAETGMTWRPPDCQPIQTGHTPPIDTDPEGKFWGWHNGIEPSGVPQTLDEACVGQIIMPYEPPCWEYGNWFKQPWLCTTPPDRVDMAYTLFAARCPEDFNGDGQIDLADLALLLAAYGSCYGDAAYDPKLDLDNDGCVGLSDLARLLAVYGTTCP